jgi:hypothetical protein
MSMFKRPSQRVKIDGEIPRSRPIEGSYLYDIIKQTPTQFYEHKKAPIYMLDSYLKMLKQNNERMGIPYVEPELPEATPLPDPVISKEPELIFGDRVQVTLRVLKSGIVRVKVNGAIATMYEKYYKKAIHPPIKEIVQAYKSHGFSKEFLEKIKKSHEKKMVFAKKVPKILEKIFDKEPVKKPKKEKKKEPEEEIVNEVPEEEEEEDDVPDEEGQMDVEPDEEEVVEEEEYFSEPET